MAALRFTACILPVLLQGLLVGQVTGIPIPQVRKLRLGHTKGHALVMWLVRQNQLHHEQIPGQNAKS